jgi:YesN/AraC family two-component response regulator
VKSCRHRATGGAASIQVVCSKIGYDDMAFFRSLFKRHTGMPPAEYRSRFAKLSFDRGELSVGVPSLAVQ